jgi:protein arginine N-methyltransferase 1
MLLAPMRGNSGRKKHGELQDARDGWDDFVQTTSANFGVDMSALTAAYTKEQTQYFLETSAWSDISPSQILGPPAVLASFDLNTVTLEEIQRPKANWVMELEDCSADTAVDAFLGWFDVDFRGSDGSPAPSPVTLDTAPDEAGATHWGQQAFYLHPSQAALAGDVLQGSFEMVRKSENHRLMTVHMSFQHGRKGPDGALQLAPPREVHYSIE